MYFAPADFKYFEVKTMTTLSILICEENTKNNACANAIKTLCISVVVLAFSSATVAAPLTLGWAEGTNTLDGALDDVRIYNRVLSASEIQALYNDAMGI